MHSDYFYEQEYNYGEHGIQPFNFVLKNGKHLKEKSYSTPKFENNLDWRNNNFSKQSKFENGSNFAVNIKKSVLKLVLLNSYKDEETKKFEKILLVPFGNGKIAQMINLNNFSKFFFLLCQNNYKNNLDSIQTNFSNGIDTYNQGSAQVTQNFGTGASWPHSEK